MELKTTDLCDAYSTMVQIAAPVFRSFGMKRTFSGPIETIKTFEDNSLVRKLLETPGEGRVLVVDGGGSMRCALLGDQLALLGVQNGWSGVIVNGCVRDSEDINRLGIGVKALATHPLKSVKRDFGDANIHVTFAGVVFTPGDYVYADADGVIVAPKALDLPN